MKITFEMDNLQNLIEKSVSGNIEEAVKSQVEDTIKEQVQKMGEESISDAVSKNFKEFVDDYIANTKITVRKEDFWGDAEKNEYTVEQYIKKCLKDCLDYQKFNTKDRNGYNKEVNFSDYIKDKYISYIDNEIKKTMDKYFKDIRDQINRTMKETFDNSTKDMLSSTVLGILTQNNTYRQLESTIRSIATKQD